MNRIINRPDVQNNRQYRIRLKEAVCSCSWCDFGRGDNQKGHLAKWGKKVAKKHEYATGKRRNDNQFKWARMHHGFRVCDYFDAHFDDFIKPKPRWRKTMKTSKGDVQIMMDGLIKQIKAQRNGLAQEISQSLNMQAQKGAWMTRWMGCWEKSNGDEGQPIEWDVYITVKRRQANHRYLPPES